MRNLFIVKSEFDFMQYNVAYRYKDNYVEDTAVDVFSFALCEDSAAYDENPQDCLLHVDEKFNIFLPLNGNKRIEIEPLPKALYLLFLRHPEGILLKNISDYRVELEYIYCKVSRRKNPTVIHRLLDEITNPLSNMLHKNLSIIRAAFLKKITADAAETFIPLRNRGREHYILLDASRIRLPEILRSQHKNSL